MLLLIIIVLLTVGISAMCSLTESILLSLSRSEIAVLAQRHPRSAEILDGLREEIEKPIAVILFINTCANTMGAIASGWQFDHVFGHDRWVLLFSVGFAFLVLQFAEILPKTIGVKHRLGISPILCRPLAWLVMAFAPVVKTIHWINRLFVGRSPAAASASLVDELRALAAMAEDEGQISARAEQIILAASDLNKLRAEHVMQPLEKTVCLYKGQTLEDALEVARETVHDRYPVLEKPGSNRPVGLVHLKQLWKHATPENRKRMRVAKLVQPTEQVLLVTDLARLLRLILDDRRKMLIVVNAAGQTLGIITLSDIMSRMLGFSGGHSTVLAGQQKTSPASDQPVISKSPDTDQIRTGELNPND
jgi:CBS domain containing-hemolysin-like protein